MICAASKEEPMPPVDMSPEAVNRRLRQVDELRSLCLTLAGPRRQSVLSNPPRTAPAPGAVFRAPAENPAGTESCELIPRALPAAGQDARAHPATPEGGCAPQQPNIPGRPLERLPNPHPS